MSPTPTDTNRNEITPDKTNPIESRNQYAAFCEDEPQPSFQEFLKNIPPGFKSSDCLPVPLNQQTIPPPSLSPCIGASCPIQLPIPPPTTTPTMTITNSTAAYPALKDKIKSSPRIASDRIPTITSLYEAKNILGAALKTYHRTI